MAAAGPAGGRPLRRDRHWRRRAVEADAPAGALLMFHSCLTFGIWGAVDPCPVHHRTALPSRLRDALPLSLTAGGVCVCVWPHHHHHRSGSLSIRAAVAPASWREAGRAHGCPVIYCTSYLHRLPACLPVLLTPSPHSLALSHARHCHSSKVAYLH